MKRSRVSSGPVDVDDSFSDASYSGDVGGSSSNMRTARCAAVLPVLVGGAGRPGPATAGAPAARAPVRVPTLVPLHTAVDAIPTHEEAQDRGSAPGSISDGEPPAEPSPAPVPVLSPTNTPPAPSEVDPVAHSTDSEAEADAEADAASASDSDKDVPAPAHHHRAHKCVDCRRTFPTPGALAAHRRIHTGKPVAVYGLGRLAFIL